MGAFFITADSADQFFKKLDSIEKAIKALPVSASETWLDNEQALKELKVSKRTLQNWRDSGIIAFSQIGHKIYYRQSDIDVMLLKHYNQSFKPP
ncbi:helix-turn-helix domain-containing protein [Adhaeribacter soli]|uniref:Helix-turn-helix domain-containing protein n=1 Tax=Adhaeribacter soli TaxID=2607655 RepID=A0A5N1ITB6_9BACT|nr:helix-turn-helix domain-containing protein [Adhaeribacter soli]KAA9331139.1 helix-turn-helix domain-containing protein [Adhaeribacter soli]